VGAWSRWGKPKPWVRRAADGAGAGEGRKGGKGREKEAGRGKDADGGVRKTNTVLRPVPARVFETNYGAAVCATHSWGAAAGAAAAETAAETAAGAAATQVAAVATSADRVSASDAVAENDSTAVAGERAAVAAVAAVGRGGAGSGACPAVVLLAPPQPREALRDVQKPQPCEAVSAACGCGAAPRGEESRRAEGGPLPLPCCCAVVASWVSGSSVDQGTCPSALPAELK
jgi:hypothetical protein